jgi:hypothetical protein
VRWFVGEKAFHYLTVTISCGHEVPLSDAGARDTAAAKPSRMLPRTPRTGILVPVSPIRYSRRVLREDLNWKIIPEYTTLPDRHRVILPDAEGYKAGAWNMLAWYSGPDSPVPLADPVRG